MAEHKLTLQELKILSAIEINEMYGYQIVKELNNEIMLGSLYNTLKQMERKGFVKSRWGTEEIAEGARRKYYKITGTGSTVLSDAKFSLMNQWGAVLNII